MSFEELKEVILKRRTIKPEMMNGERIPDETIRKLLELANWAPTHGHTEPWRFVVFTDDSLRDFSRFHADLYKQDAGDDFNEIKYNKILNRTIKTSHLIAIVMKRGDNPKVPAWEELAATACSVQNMWLGATTLGLATYWGSGGMTNHPRMREYLGFGEEDKVMGYLFLGFPAHDWPRGKRLSAIEEKATWKG